MNVSEKTVISTKDAPAAIGPYSQAVRIGDLLFCSGQIGRAPAAAAIEGDVKQQTRQVLDNLNAVLTAAGLNASHVVKTTVFLQDLNDFAAMNEIYASYFAAEGNVPPARSTVQVARLPMDALVEIEAIAKA
ncbi:MAG: RidA family protein [Acidobacteria bacterium]|nr:RidA family protein [Acidobacteriota bacterium]